jgi:deoxyadenosine/deoxycytidine kinase
MDRRIGFIGCAGTGKSTLAKALADELGVPFLASRDITETILDRDGYDYGSGIKIERFLSDVSRQKEIMKRTIQEQGECDQFVTDRTVIDLAAYAICELHPQDVKALRHIYDTCMGFSDRYTHLIVCPWSDVPIEDNRKRTINAWYQFVIAGMDLGILREWGLEFVVLESEGYEARMKDIVSAVQ